MIERVFPSGVPAPRGPYSPAVRAGDFIFVSGQVPVQVLNNVKGILAGCGATMADVVRCGVFLADGNDFAAMNAVYAEFFGDAKPARTTVVAGFVVSGLRVEIDAVAYKPA